MKKSKWFKYNWELNRGFEIWINMEMIKVLMFAEDGRVKVDERILQKEDGKRFKREFEEYENKIRNSSIDAI